MKLKKKKSSTLMRKMVCCSVLAFICQCCVKPSHVQSDSMDNSIDSLGSIDYPKEIDSVMAVRAIDTDYRLIPYKNVVDTINKAKDSRIYSEYFLFDITNDGQQELWVVSGAHKTNTYLCIYTIENGRIHKIFSGDGWHKELYICNKSIFSVVYNCREGYIGVYEYEDGKVNESLTDLVTWDDQWRATATNPRDKDIVDFWEKNHYDIALRQLK